MLIRNTLKTRTKVKTKWQVHFRGNGSDTKWRM